MTSRRPRSRRLLLPLLLAAVLVGEITGIALARSIAPAAGAGSSATDRADSAGVIRDTDRVTTAARPVETIVDTREVAANNTDAPRDRTSVAPVGPGTIPASPARSTTSTGATTQSATTGRAATTARTTTVTRPSTASASYQGRNHVWIPSLRINRSVSSFPCSRTRPPDNYVYRWGCAGKNNIYLLGHSYSVFKPLHDAYVGGRLKKGMEVIYADGAGRVRTYAVIWWRVVKPTTAASWAWAAQSKPSMTLQTCVGSRSQYRLMVRLVQVA
jgi:hypothetical protein